MRQKTYYTADETFYNLYTTGQEWMTEDLTEYKGLYHSYTTHILNQHGVLALLKN